jgi:hypothetical protein
MVGYAVCTRFSYLNAFSNTFIISGFISGMTRVVSLDGLHTRIF